MILLLQIIVIICFLIVIIALFREETDFLTYSIVAMIIAVLATFILLPEKSGRGLRLIRDKSYNINHITPRKNI